jgi:hypothetical protein
VVSPKLHLSSLFSPGRCAETTYFPCLFRCAFHCRLASANMRLPLRQPIWLLFLCAAPSLAVFADFEFAGNNGTNAKKLCGGTMPFECAPPKMCTKDTLTKRWYCCDPGYTDSVCWTQSPACTGDTKDAPSVGQIPCGPANSKFCCVKEA